MKKINPIEHNTVTLNNKPISVEENRLGWKHTYADYTYENYTKDTYKYENGILEKCTYPLESYLSKEVYSFYDKNNNLLFSGEKYYKVTQFETMEEFKKEFLKTLAKEKFCRINREAYKNYPTTFVLNKWHEYDCCDNKNTINNIEIYDKGIAFEKTAEKNTTYCFVSYDNTVFTSNNKKQFKKYIIDAYEDTSNNVADKKL